MKFCVIITTKDRPEMLGKLLESIEKNQVKPNLLSIVSSGIDVKNIISKHNSNLKILHTHLNESGQVLQRNKAINNLKEDFDYYVFLDDDVIVDNDIFLNLAKYISQNSENIGGIGLNLIEGDLKNKKNTRYSRIKNYSPLNILAGRVLNSGRNVPYLGVDKIKQVMWLNGLSVWTHPVISNFKHVRMGNKYAAAEDLIFSYEVGKNLKHYFHPGLKVQNQWDSEGMKVSLDMYRTVWQHKLYFILANKEMKLWLFILDNVFSIFIHLINIVRADYRTKIKIIFYQLRFIYVIIRDRSDLIKNPNTQKQLLNELL